MDCRAALAMTDEEGPLNLYPQTDFDYAVGGDVEMRRGGEHVLG